ncbi:DNA-binding response regulator [Streptomyces sp. NPDC097640]|uniref:response regulator transcription factor n=1 Tax=Streptomyces sp. NPDC097640 TaxID=3157229 RepID=UPI003331F314
MKRVLVVEHHHLVSSAIADLVDETPGLELAGAARSVREAISLAERRQPDVVLIDVDKSSWKSLRLDLLVADLLPRARLVRLTAVSDPRMGCLESPTNNPSVLKTAIPQFLRSLTE